jgi:hypothetical protein
MDTEKFFEDGDLGTKVPVELIFKRTVDDRASALMLLSFEGESSCILCPAFKGGASMNTEKFFERWRFRD